MIVESPARYRMPAEWEPHAATWLAWPHQVEDWPERFEPIPWVYVEIIRLLALHEAVHLIVPDQAIQQQSAGMLARSGVDPRRVHYHRYPTDRSWVRDTGPTFALTPQGKHALIDWRFNAWAKYDNWQADDVIPSRIASDTGKPLIRPECRGHRVVLEGGAIEVNGQGLLLTTEECLLSPIQERNPGMTRADYERVFAEYLGIRKVLWLQHGIAGDDTHGHVDDLARFVDVRRVLTVVEQNPEDANYRPLQDNLERLRTLTDVDGHPLEVITLPMPRPVVFDGQRLPASYANFYIANGIVLVPTFNDPADRQALGILAELFPERDVVGVHAVELVWGLGTLHCLSQQEPAEPV